jgi:hypothetical protein
MDLGASTLDLHTQELLREAFDEVRREISDDFDQSISAGVDRTIASALMGAIATGTRDPAVLKRYALLVAERFLRRQTVRRGRLLRGAAPFSLAT